MRALSAGILALMLVVTACGDDAPTEPETPTVNGSWTGSGGDFSFDLTLSESESGSISGSGTAEADEPLSLTISGTHAHPDVSLTMSSSGYSDLNFSGEFSGDDTIHGSLNGSGFDNFALTLNR
ncbi:MAG: hypothetical protein ACODAA_08110 [Gemmatimonadota bacterium]